MTHSPFLLHVLTVIGSLEYTQFGTWIVNEAWTMIALSVFSLSYELTEGGTGKITRHCALIYSEIKEGTQLLKWNINHKNISLDFNST